MNNSKKISNKLGTSLLTSNITGDAKDLRRAMNASKAVLESRKSINRLMEIVNSSIYPIALDICNNLGIKDAGEVASKMVTIYPSSMASYEFLWVREAILCGRKWSALPVEFLHRLTGLVTMKPAKFQSNISIFDLIQNVPDHPMVTIGITLSKSESSAYEALTGRKASFITSMLYMYFVSSCLDAGVITDEFLDLIKLPNNRVISTQNRDLRDSNSNSSSKQIPDVHDAIKIIREFIPDEVMESPEVAATATV